MKPIIAIVGSARHEIMGENENNARQAAQLLGKALAESGWRIAVYGSEQDYIEHDVVKGYVAGTNVPNSIICIYPNGVTVNFEAMNDSEKIKYFDFQVDTTSDWEVSFYRSIKDVNAMLLFGGKGSAFIAGQVALSYNLPIIAVAYFQGDSEKSASVKIWSEHLSKKPGYIEDVDLQVMGRWTPNSPKEFVESLNRQYEKGQKKLVEEKQKIEEAQKKARLYDQLLEDEKKQKGKAKLALVFLVIFLICFIVGLVAILPGWIYTTITLLGLCFAGGMGATIRMLAPKPPDSGNKWNGPVIGVMVGLVFSLIYLIPQLVQQSGFLIPGDTSKGITTAIRAQFVCSTLVAVLAGLGFDYAIEQLVKKSQQQTDKLTNDQG